MHRSLTLNISIRTARRTFRFSTTALRPHPVNAAGQQLFGVTNNYITSADNFGTQYQRFNGIDISANARPRNGLTLQGGLSFGRTTADTCEIRAKLPESAPLNPF